MKAKPEYEPPFSNFLKDEEYDNFKEGDIVSIKGEHGTRYTFHGVTTNTNNGAQWANLFGGKKGTGPQLRGRTSGFRAVDPKRLRRVR